MLSINYRVKLRVCQKGSSLREPFILFQYGDFAIVFNVIGIYNSAHNLIEQVQEEERKHLEWITQYRDSLVPADC